MELAFLAEPAFWVVVALASELIGMSPLKDNSIIQLVLHSLNRLKPKKSSNFSAAGGKLTTLM